MTKRLLTLTDDELDLLVAWGVVTHSASLEPMNPAVVAHDWEDDDDELLEKVKAVRLR